jgi:hypothetical protein
MIPPNDGLSKNDDINDRNIGEAVVDGDLPGENEVVVIVENYEQMNEEV